jgi:hypothetical protein
MQGKGFSRETVGFLLNGASFGTFLPLVGEKYINAIKQINPNLKNTHLRALSFAEGKTR